MDAILGTLHFHSVQWGPMLDQFAVLNVKLARMQEQLRPLLKHYAVYPTALTQGNAEVLHLLLATKLLPDMEEAEQKVLDQEGLCTEEAHIEDLYARLSKQLDDHNEILQHLTVKAEAQDSGVLDPKGLARQKVTETSRKIARIVAKLHEKRGAPARTKKLGRNTAQTKETVPDGKPKSKPDGREILLRAMLTGEGLKEAKT